jgi:transcriptional regulator with XRE-family HTH domain
MREIAAKEEKKMIHPGLRLRQARERLGLTYRDVERASFELAARRGRPEFVLRISRLADIENHEVVPGLHKLYTLAAVYHLSPVEISGWYDVPLADFFQDGSLLPSPLTHLAAAPATMRVPMRFDPAFDPQRTEFLSRMVERWGRWEGALGGADAANAYGYVGLADRRMEPLLRPGSVVLVDTRMRQIENGAWTSEYDRPLYFVDVRTGYRCGWFSQEASRLILHPHPLSRCSPETYRFPEEAEVVGRVVGVVTRLNEDAATLSAESREAAEHSSRRAS